MIGSQFFIKIAPVYDDVISVTHVVIK